MEGKKFDSGKPRMELLPMDALEEVAKVLAFGATKYQAWNWALGMDHSRLLGASLRHLTAYHQGENKDPESGEEHLAHAACCLLFLLSMRKHGTGRDDRWRSGS